MNNNNNNNLHRSRNVHSEQDLSCEALKLNRLSAGLQL